MFISLTTHAQHLHISVEAGCNYTKRQQKCFQRTIKSDKVAVCWALGATVWIRCGVVLSSLLSFQEDTLMIKAQRFNEAEISGGEKHTLRVQRVTSLLVFKRNEAEMLQLFSERKCTSPACQTQQWTRCNFLWKVGDVISSIVYYLGLSTLTR